MRKRLEHQQNQRWRAFHAYWLQFPDVERPVHGARDECGSASAHSQSAYDRIVGIGDLIDKLVTSIVQLPEINGSCGAASDSVLSIALKASTNELVRSDSSQRLW